MSMWNILWMPIIYIQYMAETKKERTNSPSRIQIEPLRTGSGAPLQATSIWILVGEPGQMSMWNILWMPIIYIQYMAETKKERTNSPSRIQIEPLRTGSGAPLQATSIWILVGEPGQMSMLNILWMPIIHIQYMAETKKERTNSPSRIQIEPLRTGSGAPLQATSIWILVGVPGQMSMWNILWMRIIHIQYMAETQKERTNSPSRIQIEPLRTGSGAPLQATSIWILVGVSGQMSMLSILWMRIIYIQYMAETQKERTNIPSRIQIEPLRTGSGAPLQATSIWILV
jgi:lipid-A-disaccharide synthase-like uncharacterized protein